MYNYIIILNAKAVYGCKNKKTALRHFEEYKRKYNQVDNSIELIELN